MSFSCTEGNLLAIAGCSSLALIKIGSAGGELPIELQAFRKGRWDHLRGAGRVVTVMISGRVDFLFDSSSMGSFLVGSLEPLFLLFKGWGGRGFERK